MKNVLAVLISNGGPCGRTEAEVLSAAARLSEGLGADLSAAILGSSADDTWKQEAFAYGAQKVYLATGEQLSQYQSEVYAGALQELYRASGAEVVVLPSSSYGLETAPLFAYQITASITLDVVEATGEGGAVRITKPVYGGKANLELVAREAPVVIAMRMRSVALTERREEATGESIEIPVPSRKARTKLIERRSEAVAGPRLEDARIIVSGGRGIGSAENFKRLESLAEILGGTVGASRAACDLGWVSASLQIGQTGKKVAPDLYLAIGISGASQHMVGITGAKHIVAINKDERAPIFRQAEIGVVEDYNTFLPELVQALQRSKGLSGGAD